MDRNTRIARELVRIARELVAFKGAQKIIDAIVGMTGWDINDPDEFRKIDDAKKKVVETISWAATVDGKVRDMYLDWMRDCACNGEIEQFVKSYGNMRKASIRNATFFSMNDDMRIVAEDQSVHDISRCISFLFHGNQKHKKEIDDVSGRIKSKTITIGEMKDIILPIVEKQTELSNSNKRTSLMRKFENEGKKVYSNGSWSVILFDDIGKRQDLIDFAGHCTIWCITGQGKGGDVNFNTYSDKYYVICEGNKPVCCFYNDHGVLWFELRNGSRFNSKNDKGNGYKREDVYILYKEGDQTLKELLKDIIPDICIRLGVGLDWKVG